MKKLIQLIRKVPYIINKWEAYKEIKQLELLQMEKDAYWREFSGDCYGGFYGVYDSFEEARSAAPKTKQNHYNSKDQAEWDKQQIEVHFEKLQSYDYPVVHWISRLYERNKKSYNILDFGGNAGNHFYAYNKALVHDFIRKWLVCDLPSITALGEEFKKNHEADLLSFVNSLPMNYDVELFLASGSIQYVDESDPTFFIRELERKPKYLIINRIPLLQGESKQKITLQNVHKAYAPMYTYNHNEFFNAFSSKGYKVLDIWRDFGCNCIIPHEKKLHIPYYHGTCMRLMEN
jgi:putative methyltransferase (TIGR04325 family)